MSTHEHKNPIQKIISTVLNPLWVLMWKYVKERNHRYCHTFWQIFGGVSVFLVIFLINQTLSPQRATRIFNTDLVTKVFYTPHDNFTRRLMNKVKYYLDDKDTESEIEPPLHWDFINENANLPSMNSLNSSDSMAFIYFKTNGSLLTNSSLAYSIYAIGSENKSRLETAYNGFFRGLIPKEESVTIPTFLGNLQWAIDKSYIEDIAAQDIEETVQLRSKPEYISKELRTVHKFMILCTIIAPLPYFLIYSARLIVERRSGLRELMKLNGISPNVLRFSHFLESIIVAVMYTIPVIVLLKITSKPILPYSDERILAITIILHFVNSMSLAFVTTTWSQDYSHADILGLLIYMSTFLLDFLWYSQKDNLVVIYTLCCVLPHTPIYLFWDEVLYLERIGQGTQFWNFRLKHLKTCMPVSRVWGFFLIQLAIITSLAWYLDLVRPGRYGVSKKWNFMFQKAYWSYEDKKVNFQQRVEQPVKRLDNDERYFEKGPRKAEVAIKVLNVTKKFKNIKHVELTALDSINFDCYKGEVTVILGAHGAGKSSLISIVTGMFSATQGTVFINGKDVAHKIRELREDMALCPQRNLTFKYLTVRENIVFFQKLKSKSKEGFTVDQLMRKLRLTEKANYFSRLLGGGKLRCLQVACTLAAGADVLVLDEPTSGMHVDDRHRLWDLIMVLRGEKTILMSTTYLEEATALGDRIVILSNGKLRCHGTPMFLKQAIGVSFNLSVTIRDSTQMMYLKELVEGILPDVKYRIHDVKRITFSLPSKDHETFPQLFEVLEGNRNALGITLIDVGMFMEEVFLEFIEEEHIDQKFEMRMSISTRHVETRRMRGFKLLLRHISLLIKRVYQYSWMKKYQFIFLQILMPMIGLVIITLGTNHKLGYDKMFSHDISKLTDVTLVYNTGPFRRTGLLDTMNKYPEFNAVYSDDVDADFSDPSGIRINKETVGLKMTKHYTRIFYPPDPYFITKTINMYSNIYMSTYMPYLDYNISTSYQPLLRGSKIITEPKSAFLCMKWSVGVVFLSVLPLAPMIILSIKEYSVGTRDSHMMAGCSPIVHWISKLLAHLAQYWVIIPAPVFLLTVLLDFDKTFNQVQFLGSLFAILLIFGPAFLVHLYFLSFIFHENTAISEVYIMSLCFGIILPVMLSVLEPIWKSNYLIGGMYWVLIVVGRISPLYAFAIGLARLTLCARRNAFCKFNRHMCPHLEYDDDIFSSELCCGTTKREPFKYLVSFETGLFDLMTLVLQFLIYSFLSTLDFGAYLRFKMGFVQRILVISLENRDLQYLVERILLYKYKEPTQAVVDDNVEKEKIYVKSMMKRGKSGDDVLLVDNVHKTFIDTYREHGEHAVKGISFAAKLGECIALLGPNGSGKTSILKALAGSKVMTRGNSCIDGHYIRKDRSKYIHKIFLTSNTGGMDNFMTGYQNLVFIAKLRGYSDEMSSKLALLALRFMGLKPNGITVSQLSSGYVRRLSLCSTLVIAPMVAFLDAPMRDIDANTKPLVAKALQRLVLEPAAVVVAASNVDWRLMQPVFTRIAIMSKGQLVKLGPAEEILGSLANGYTARVKLKVVTAYREDLEIILNDDEASIDSELSQEDNWDIHTEKSVLYAGRVVLFKNEFKKIFHTSVVTAEHLCMLYFYIEDKYKTLLYSEMFNNLENLKRKYDDVVEDYTLNSTTVEDVFWRLTHAEGKHHHHSHHNT